LELAREGIGAGGKGREGDGGWRSGREELLLHRVVEVEDAGIERPLRVPPVDEVGVHRVVDVREHLDAARRRRPLEVAEDPELPGDVVDVVEHVFLEVLVVEVVFEGELECGKVLGVTDRSRRSIRSSALSPVAVSTEYSRACSITSAFRRPSCPRTQTSS